MKCPECNGSGRIVLFVSSKPCKRCGGTGEIEGEISIVASNAVVAAPLFIASNNGITAEVQVARFDWETRELELKTSVKDDLVFSESPDAEKEILTWRVTPADCYDWALRNQTWSQDQFGLFTVLRQSWQKRTPLEDTYWGYQELFAKVDGKWVGKAKQFQRIGRAFYDPMDPHPPVDGAKMVLAQSHYSARCDRNDVKHVWVDPASNTRKVIEATYQLFSGEGREIVEYKESPWERIS